MLMSINYIPGKFELISYDIYLPYYLVLKESSDYIDNGKFIKYMKNVVTVLCNYQSLKA